MTPERQELIRNLTVIQRLNEAQIRDALRREMARIEWMILGDGSDVRSLEKQKREESGSGTQEGH